MLTRTLFTSSVAFAFASTAQAATPAFGYSESYNLASTIQLLQIAPVNMTDGLAPQPYDASNTVINLDLSGLLDPLVSLSTGVLTSNASSNADGLPGSRYASASSLVDGLSLSVLGLLGNVLQLDLGAVNSYATVSGTPGSFTAVGGSYLADVKLDTLLTSPLTVDVWPNLAPNTRIVDNLLGITLTFNEQIENCGTDFCELTVNALNLQLDNVALGVGNLLGLNGNLIVGHSYALLSAAPIPEASEWSMMLAGLGLIGFVARRRVRG